MPVLKSRPEKNYTTVPNSTVAQNDDLSMKERGLLLLLLSLPSDWEFRISDLVERIPEGRDALRSGVEDLEEKSFVYREERRKANGARAPDRWFVFDVPRPEFSPDEEPRSENPTGGPPENPIRAQNGKSDPNKGNNKPSTKKQDTNDRGNSSPREHERERDSGDLEELRQIADDQDLDVSDREAGIDSYGVMQIQSEVEEVLGAYWDPMKNKLWRDRFRVLSRFWSRDEVDAALKFTARQAEHRKWGLFRWALNNINDVDEHENDYGDLDKVEAALKKAREGTPFEE